MVIVWLFSIVVLAIFVIYSAFLVLCGARLILSQGVELVDGMMIVAKIWLVIGYPADIVYNWTVGAWRFRSGWLPEWRGTTYSSHIQWRVDRGLWDPVTVHWVRILDGGDKGHIETPDGFPLAR